MTENTLSSTPSINQSHEVTSFHLRIFFSYNFQIINFSVTTVLLFFKSLLNDLIYLEFNTFHSFIKCPYSEFLWSLISRIPTGYRYFFCKSSHSVQNVGKYGTEKVQIRTHFLQWLCTLRS